MFTIQHKYLERNTQKVCTEQLYADAIIRFLYSSVREHAPTFFKLLTSAWSSKLLGFVNFEMGLGARLTGSRRFLRRMGVVFDECFEDPQSLNTVKKIFERKIRYWECRPIPEDPCMIVSPADARMIAGSFSETSGMFLKGKFFDYKELFGRDKQDWLRVFYRGDFLICRLTPEKYHYNHLPVDGKVVDIYEIPGDYHSCNPGAVVVEATPYSKNKRVVTVIDTDVPAGTKIGLVAMIEVVALMIGEIVQCYSEYRYDFPKSVERGMFLRKGFPKSLYRPGSSTTVIVFQKGLVTFADDVVRNMYMSGINSRFSIGFGMPLVETDVQVRSCVAYKKRG